MALFLGKVSRIKFERSDNSLLFTVDKSENIQVSLKNCSELGVKFVFSGLGFFG